MCESKGKVVLWCLVETDEVSYIGEGEWPIPRNLTQHCELDRAILYGLLGGLRKIVGRDQRVSLTVMLSNLPHLAVELLFAGNRRDLRLVEENEEQITWAKSLIHNDGRN